MNLHTTIKAIQTEYYYIELAETSNKYIITYSTHGNEYAAMNSIDNSYKTISDIKDMSMALELFDIKHQLLQGH